MREVYPLVKILKEEIVTIQLYIKERQIKSGGQSLKSFNLKPQSQNFLKTSKETSGGGFY